MQTLSAVKRIRTEPRQIAGGTGSEKGQSPLCSCQPVADGFLNHNFLPRYQPEATMLQAHEVEMGYFSSLAILSKVHGIEPMDVRGKPYPYNVLLSHWDMKRKLNRQPIETGLHIVQDDNERVRLATRQVWKIGHTLYYIPVMPLFKLLRIKERKATAELLLSVMAYLYHEAGIPYYRQESSFLHYHYQMNKDWLEDCKDEYDDDEYQKNASDILKTEYCGDVMERRIYNRYQLEHFTERLDAYKPGNGLERDCLRVAADAFGLMREYPGHTVFRHVAEPEPDDESACFEAYVSFICKTDGWFYENVERGVSDELNEYADTTQPCVIQVFDDTEAKRKEGLEFEYRLFELISDLTTILFDLP
jgi:hypothetical protein